MADISADSLLSSSGDGVLLSGAQEFTFGGVDSAISGLGVKVNSGINISAGLTNLVSLTGKYIMDFAAVNAIDTTSGSLQFQIIIDGVAHVNATEASSTRSQFLAIDPSRTPIKCNSSLVIKATKPLATSVSFRYSALAIL